MPDTTTIERLRGLVLSANDLKALTNWPDALIEDYLNIVDNLITITNLLDVEIDQTLEEIPTAFTDGSIPFAESELLVEDNTNLVWDNVAKVLTVAGALISGILTLQNTGLHILDTDASHDLTIKPGSNLTADRILTLTTGDAARKLSLLGNLFVESLSRLNQDLTTDAEPTFAGALLTDNLTLPKTSGKGIRVDTGASTFGWRDLVGAVEPKSTGAGKATLGVWRGGLVKVWFYDTNDTLDILQYHLPHDYVPGSDLHIHLHWGHHGTAISGSLVVTFGVTYAKGHNQVNFPAEVAPVITVATPNITTVPQYRHRIDEIQLSAASPSGTQIDSDDIEPDGIILLGMIVTTIPTITGGVVDKPAFFEIDIHYQSTNIATKDKAPDFYT